MTLAIPQWLDSTLKEWDLPHDQRVLSRFHRYRDLLLDWNQRINLTRIVDEEGIAVKHIADSVLPLSLAGDVFPPGAMVADIGSGAGFPGLPIAICREDLHITLWESAGKKVRFLLETVRTLGLDNVDVVEGRADPQCPDPARRYDTALTRALGSFERSGRHALPLLTSQGAWVYYGGPSAVGAQLSPLLRKAGAESLTTMRRQIHGPTQEVTRVVLVCRKRFT